MHNRTQNVMRGVGLSGVLAIFSGCAGSRADVTFVNSTAPISLSGTVRGSDGRILANQELKTVGSFETKYKRSWAIVDSAARFRKSIDFSEEINQAVAAKGGEAVTNLEIRAFNCGMNYVIPFTILPIWPGCVKVKLAGDVVMREAAPREHSVSDPVGSEAIAVPEGDETSPPNDSEVEGE